jgi:hypothetical protein
MANIFSAEIARIQEAIRITQANIARDQALLAQDPTNERLKTQIASGQNYLIDLDAQLAFFGVRESAPVASSGQIVRDDAQGTQDRPQTPNPDPEILTPDGRIVARPDTTSGTTADPSVSTQAVDTGTNAPVKTISQTQATPAELAGPGLLRDPRDADAQAGGFYGGGVAPAVTQIGVGAGPEDTGVATKNATRVEIDNVFNESVVTPKPNVLDQYASYTYVSSVYLVPKATYDTMMNTKQKNLTGGVILFQSGGGGPPAGRNPYFSLDYYIDKIEIKSFINGKGTGLSHNAKEINMTVVEPSGITLIDNITRAVQGIYPNTSEKKNILDAVFLLVIRFYGYDDQGNLVRGGVARPNGTTDQNAFVEKWFPFVIKDIKFKVASKIVEYDITAAAPQYRYNIGTARASIPYNIELSGQTVKDLLSGTAQYTVTEIIPVENGDNYTAERAVSVLPPPEKASSAPSPKTTIRQGLMAALNEHQQRLTQSNPPTQRYADEFSIAFVGAGNAPSAIANARIVPPGRLDKGSTSMAVPATAADAKLGTKQSMDANSRVQSATAGMQIVQFIDQVLRNSTYLKDQQLVEVDQDTGEISFNGTPAQNVAWFKISLEAKAMMDKWDDIRKQFAYKIKYIVSPYKLSDLNSKYFPTPKFTGVQKEYQYWFTGQNTQVLNYEENIDGLYYLTLSGANFNTLVSIPNEQNEQIHFNFAPNSVESSQGAKGNTNEPVANAAEQLYQPNALKTADLTIIGDPAWLQQGEGSLGQNTSNWNFGSFLPDGTLNFDSQQILFRVAFNAPADYDTSTGLMNPGLASSQAPSPAQGAPRGPAQINRVYIASECTSTFHKGKFIQNIKGSLMNNETTADNRAATAAVFNQQQKAVQAMSNSRQLNTTSVLAAIKTPAFTVNSSLNSVMNQAVGATNGVNAANQGLNLLAGYSNGVLGGQSTRPFQVPGLPTSSGLPVGLVNSVISVPNKLIAGATNSINNAVTNQVNQILASGEKNIRGVVDSVSKGSTQIVAGSDDAGDELTRAYLNLPASEQTRNLDVAPPTDLGEFFG